MNRLIELLQDLRELQMSRNDAWRILAAKYAVQPVYSRAVERNHEWSSAGSQAINRLSEEPQRIGTLDASGIAEKINQEWRIAWGHNAGRH